MFRRRASSATAAAAICWIVGKDNDLFTTGRGILVKDLMAYFGLAQGGVSQRAETLMKAAGFDPSARQWDLRLGAPELLVAERRRRMIELRDEYVTDL